VRNSIHGVTFLIKRSLLKGAIYKKVSIEIPKPVAPRKRLPSRRWRTGLKSLNRAYIVQNGWVKAFLNG
jgi:hypothetical protein